MQLKAVNSLQWASRASDPPNIRSLLLYQHSNCQLYSATSKDYAVSLESGLQQGRPFTRFTVYGLLHGAQEPDYHNAAQQINSIVTEDVMKGSAIPQAAVQALTDVFQQHGWRLTYCQPCHQFVLIPEAQEAVLAATLALPPGYRMDEEGLTPQDAKLVDQLWTFRSDTSLALIQEIIAGRHTSCVRQADGSPVAWMLEVEPLCAGMLHVLEGHRRQGLARAVCADLFTRLHAKWQQRLQQPDVVDAVGEASGPAVYCYVVEDNTASMRLMQSLHLRCTGLYSWMAFDRVERSRPGLP